MNEVWDNLRYLNQYLAVIAAIFVSYRLTLMMLDSPRWKSARPLHFMMWMTYVVAALFLSAISSNYYDRGATPATWTSGGRFALHLAAIGLSIWWPHPRKFSPFEAHDDDA